MRNNLKTALSIVALLAVGQTSTAITAGSLVKKENMGSAGAEDYVLALRISNKDSQGSYTGYCTGVLIAPNALLTAGHCFKNKGATAVAVAGVNADSGKSLRVKQIYINPNYNRDNLSDPKSQLNDIAIIQLKKPIGELQRIAKLPGANDTPPTHENLTVVGYGRTSLTSKNIDTPDFGKLRKGINSIYSTFEGVLVINQTEKSGICEGDSGGPLLQETASGFTVWGTALHASLREPKQATSTKVSESKDLGKTLSENKDRDFCKGYGKYTDIRYHLNWINQTLSQFK